MFIAAYCLAEDDIRPLIAVAGRPPDHNELCFNAVREMAWLCPHDDAAVDLFLALSLLASVTEAGPSVDACRDRFLALMDALQSRETLH